MKKFKVEHKGHYYATSAAEWKVDNDINKLVKFMEKAGYPFVVIFVPLPIAADYKIEGYAPVVEGCVLLAEYKLL